MRLAWTALAAAALALLPAAVTSPTAHAASAAAYTLPLTDAIGALPVAAEDRTGYDREEAFGGWIDADRDGCNTRAEVLLTEAVEPPIVTGRCKLSGGLWYSWYDNKYVTLTDIDHMVPLAEAWDSGASQWTKQRRVAYANYLDDERHLEAVSQRSNRQKADQDPTTWLVPDNPSQTCRYVANWTAVKLQWGLSVDPAEQQKLISTAANCPDTSVAINPVP
ncbi:HNH endonuclease family protein [Streptomyces naphthomycinicus]|uniref:HNH endonuclease family protein n=1 Tax=Streptomyces naphthomycinicus TaxID=2872625 RepID=UPI001CECC2AE|nr:HNH endonuclease family protein [Streptomyces sp. TML10]